MGKSWSSFVLFCSKKEAHDISIPKACLITAKAHAGSLHFRFRHCAGICSRARRTERQQCRFRKKRPDAVPGGGRPDFKPVHSNRTGPNTLFGEAALTNTASHRAHLQKCLGSHQKSARNMRRRTPQIITCRLQPAQSSAPPAAAKQQADTTSATRIAESVHVPLQCPQLRQSAPGSMPKPSVDYVRSTQR
jgi:hypothetical protein